MDPLIIFFGLGVGILVGLTGVGGGSLMTPLLLLAGGYSPVVAIGTDLAYGAVTKTVGGWRHLRAGHVDLRLSWWLAAGSIPGSLLGVAAVNRLHDAYGDGFEPYLLATVAVALMLAAAATLYRALFRPGLVAAERESALLEGHVSKAGTVAIGAFLGFVLGMTSVGSGALIGLTLILLYKLNPRRVVGTDVFHAAVLLWTAGLAHFASGNVDLALMATILAGSLPGVWIGTWLVPHVPVVGLRHALGIVLAAAALGVLSKAGAGISPLTIVAVPLLLAVVSVIVHRRHSTAATGPARPELSTARPARDEA
ncbi:MAG TPA: sulfite exporter TauE/SafE family protein [Solirubrobacteraceae bacterium]|nr:sulfite exporter TauE/SafE family protein [Solirubrobacteraceae bacterium]